jgi:hypothetical protein
MLKYKIVLSTNIVELEGHVNKWMRDNDATPLGGVIAIVEENTPPPGTHLLFMQAITYIEDKN